MTKEEDRVDRAGWMEMASDNVEEILILDIYKYFVYLLNILFYQQRKDDVSKSVVAAMEFTVELNLLTTGVTGAS